MTKKITLDRYPFGQIISISGMNIVIKVNKDYTEKLEQEADNKTYSIGTVGEIFMVGGPTIDDKIHYGIFDEVKLVSNFVDFSNPTTNQDLIPLTDKDSAVIVAKIIGYQDINTKDKFQFRRGIGHYPKFNSKCYLLTPEEKQGLFALDENGLNIGKTPDVNNENVLIKVDKFLNKHSVILGSTGSGKSYTVASIFQKVLHEHKFSHIVFFDLHNEYSNAFPNDVFNVNKLEALDFDLPYWFLNFEEFQAIFLGDIDYSKNSKGIRILKDEILKLKRESHDLIKAEVGDIYFININSPLYFSFKDLFFRLKNLNKRTIYKSDGKDAWNSVEKRYEISTGNKKVKRVDNGEEDQCHQDPNYYGQLYGVIEKLDSIFNDRRFQFLFPDDFEKSTDLYGYLENLLSIQDAEDQKQISIIDLSKIPSEVNPVIIGILARITFEYKVWDENPHKVPVYLIFEEAHNYIPHETNAITKLPTKYIGRIAKEGRKYGISQLIISQRPSDLSPLIVSQCSNFFVLRVTNPNDQSFILNVLPDHLSSLASMIPFFQSGECLIAGEQVEIPVRALIDYPKHEPNSGDVPFSEVWKKQLNEYNIKDVVHNWWEIQKS